ncbi:CobW family GTP-binding protein [Cohnella nanjingensis]|uniref:GTP-binding protein n=1 Tax=Cohnella nanjingensis TaxID=1387779 RepID=A0A7X0RKP2_9BACL|nr:GTP-binding protein [Cohnella nanjingensis]MBB6669228.1 GTP-binding protein [Cohnella nanjingensis]
MGETNAVKVYALSGFLGSGKTTMLQRMLADARARGEKAAVLMNESGEVNLDGLLVDSAVPMAEMLGGCICCTIKADLGMELLRLVEEHRPDVVWIESTGVAQPLAMMDAVTEASLYAHLELCGLVTVVDARHLLDRMRVGAGKTLRLMRDQIRGASLLVLNKTDLVGEAEIAELAAQLREWNASAPILPSVRCEVNPEAIERALPGRFRSRPDGTDERRRDGGQPQAREHGHHREQNHEQMHERDQSHDQGHSRNHDHAHDHAHDHNHAHSDNHDHRHERNLHQDRDRNQDHSGSRAQGHSHPDRERAHDHVNVLTHYLSGPVDSADFERMLRELPDGVYRAKGIVTFTDTASRFLFQYAYKETDFLRIAPQKPVPDVAVFLGEDFSSSDVLARLLKLTRQEN